MQNRFKLLNRFSPQFFKGSIRVGMGEIAIGEADVNLRIPVVGSCIGLVLYVQFLPRDARIAMMAHIMYPSSDQAVNPHNDEFGLGKYADKAINMMIISLEDRGYQKKDFAAKMAGGMKLINEQHQVNSNYSESNASAAIKKLRREKITLKTSHTGESKGLELIFKIKEYRLYVTPEGEPTIIL